MNFKAAIIIFSLFLSTTVHAKIKVITTIPEFAWLFEKVGNESVDAVSLLKGDEDPHYVDAVPNFILQASRADILCFVGLELEVGWLPKVVEAAGNQKIIKGSPGYCDMSENINVLGKIEGPIDRSMGHLHSHGNPHYWLSAKIMSQLALDVADRLSVLEPENQKVFQERARKLSERLTSLQQQRRAVFREFENARIIQYHSEFTYLLKDLELPVIDFTIEEKPGVSPSASAISRTAERSKQEGVVLGLASHSAPKKKLEAFERLADLEVRQIYTMTRSKDFMDFYQSLTDQLRQDLVSVSADDKG